MMLLVGFGGAIGAFLRYQISESISKRRFNTTFPVATFIINMLGSFGLGLLFSMYEQGVIDKWVWLFIGTGFFGAFTTFSTFSVEIMRMIGDGKRLMGIFYLLLSIIVGLTFASIGMSIQ